MKRISLFFLNGSRAFLRSQGGHAAVLFGLMIMPLMGFIGAAVDYSRANSVKAAMQNATDATALALSKNPSLATMSGGQLQSSADSYFRALFKRAEAKNVQVNAPVYTSQSGNYTLSVSATATLPTDFTNFLHVNAFNLSTTSTVAWGNMKLRVALVLDNTGSMAQNGKMSALKTASHQLLQQLQAAAKNPGDVQVSIIPFTTDVNIGTGPASQFWIDWSQWSPRGSIENGLNCSSRRSGCGSTNHSTWNGCVMDRTQSYDVKNSSPVQNNVASYFPADQSAWCPQQLMALSDDWTALGNKIDAMVPNGDTNQTIGLVWGWQSLSEGLPLNAPPLPANTQQFIILLTDGLNTQNRWTYSASLIDARTQAVCDNIKAANIQIFTVLVMSGDSTVLQNCASSPAMYFALTNAGDIVTTFNQIGTSISQLRIAK
jgi:Flp pilus assembly protein TadG